MNLQMKFIKFIKTTLFKFIKTTTAKLKYKNISQNFSHARIRFDFRNY